MADTQPLAADIMAVKSTDTAPALSADPSPATTDAKKEAEVSKTAETVEAATDPVSDPKQEEKIGSQAEASTEKQATTAASTETPASSVVVDKTRPKDFEGEISTNNEIPSQATLKKIEDYIVLDGHGKSHTFKSLYSGPNSSRRVLIIFIRHFFCGVSLLFYPSQPTPE